MLKKLAIRIASILLLIGAISPTVNATTLNKSTNLSEQDYISSIKLQETLSIEKTNFIQSTNKQEQITKVANELKYLFEEASTLNEDNQIIDINFDKLEQHYGNEATNSDGYKYIKQYLLEQKSSRKRGFVSCMEDGIKDYIGGSLWSAILEGGAKALIEEMAWEELAALIVELAGSEFTVVVLVGALSWMAVNCL
ncbi:hypothetical protein JE040_12355 [Enterococcus xinjiangensis]|uniref:hypothetical protein n=1 Tax=Enterococcus TaxID=1350 RepID=UPI000D3D73E0|nr:MULTISPECIES: hypothetical protein [Enterococcus]MBK1999596.1 hypothetical protein [Enterococcus lactis]MDW7897142.1 hypothetical protein [Enterococcus faecium]PWQ89607.1 hypothetical protein DKX15_12935 [Enterococcus faecium]RAX29764.1 hypothetical protein DQE80_13020 [Enterococcus sp. HPCN18]